VSVEVVSTTLKGSFMDIYANEDLFVNLTQLVQDERKFYGISTLEHVPEFEITPLAQAHAGNIVRKGKHVGIVYNTLECGGNYVLFIVFNSGRTTTHTRSL
jgi:hypothetical protein